MSSKENEPGREASDEDRSGQKPKIYTDEAKDRHTTHWDMDYMTREELEQAYRDAEANRSKLAAQEGEEWTPEEEPNSNR